MRRPLAVALAAALLLLPVSACIPNRARKNATPTSAANPEAKAAIRRLRDVGLLAPSKVPGDYEQLAKVTLNSYTVCGADPLAAYPPAGRVATAYGNSRNNLIAQSIMFYPDVATATSAFTSLTQALNTCGSFSSGEANATAKPVTAPLPNGAADQVAAYVTSNASRVGPPYTGTVTVIRQGQVLTQISTFTLNEPGITSAEFDKLLANAAKAIRTANGPEISPSSAPN